MPAETPLTTPEVFTEATAGLLLLQVPPVAEPVNVVVVPVQIDVVPVIVPAVAERLIVINLVVTAVPQLFDTV